MKRYYGQKMWDSSISRYVSNPDYIPELIQTYRIQRLMRSQIIRSSGNGFGKELSRYGFTPEAWEYLGRYCSLHPMGSAAFEQGAVPEAFQSLHLCSTLEAFTIPVIGNPVLTVGDMRLRYHPDILESVAGKHDLEMTIFVIAPAEFRPHVEDLILQLAIDENDLDLVRPTGLKETVFSRPEWADIDQESWKRSRTRGWLELDNGFLFFSEPKMWIAFCDMLGIEVPPYTEIRADFSEIDMALREMALHTKPVKHLTIR